MLPLINLDDQNFQDIFEEARKMISGVYPDWTDYNEHDPGITLLELFSWLKEMQQFHLNQIGSDQLLMYLKLLGMQQHRRSPAKALVRFMDITKDILLPKGSKLYASDICFETKEMEYLEDIKILQCVSRRKSKEDSMEESTVEEAVIYSGSYFRFPMFGMQPKKGDEFLIKLDQPFEPGRTHSIYFKIWEDYPVTRNRISKEYFEPLAKLSLEYYYASNYHPCRVIKDETHQLIQSGKLYFQPEMHMQKRGGGYWLKLKIEECSYDVAPILQEIAMNVVYTEQVSTLSEFEDFVIDRQENGEYALSLSSHLAMKGIVEVYRLLKCGYKPYDDFHINYEEDKLRLSLGNIFDDLEDNQLTLRIVACLDEFSPVRTYETDGFPYQSIDLEDEEILYDSMVLLAENELYPGYYDEWQKVDNFYCSTPVDCHYIFDEERGQILFGNCENGKAPEGNVIIIGYRTTLGLDGNVKAGQINHFPTLEQVRVSNRDNATEGMGKESIEACFGRFMREFCQVNRAITDKDYEELVKRTPGLMIQNVMTVPISNRKKKDGSIEENCVSLVVQPFTSGDKAILSNAYMDNINYLLDKKRLVGTKLMIMSPEYIGISIFGEIVVKAHYINAREYVHRATTEYFDALGNVFGKTVSYNEIYGILDALDCVSEVHNLSINSQGRSVQRTMNGDLLLPVNGLAFLKDVQYFITSIE